ncbi:hypothetical protein SY85_17580 [Flavisolibacter tropicus]|uniref:TonB-dependent receptor n=1 Tax=Flavisolibacter tropicus TaxID=1492898 RepID=A0A172U3K9_9BACT|nr:hypothetical protein SY85_17580 [Flavisolibacter tropicus]
MVFTYVGYQTLERQVSGNNVSVQLSQGENALSEVVVVAYGTQKKESFTGSISTIKSDVIKERPVSSFDKALQGAAAGVTVQSVSGQPGAATTVRIRGVGSFSASSSPLYVVDGVAITTGDFTQSAQTANVLSTLNPSDIESISVLKDASAASLYGSRAANGVIVITTKRGRSGKTKINVSGSQGWSSIAVDKHDVMTTQQYFKYWWDYYYATRIAAGDAPATAATKANASTITNLSANPYNNANPYDANGNLNSGVNALYDNNWTDAATRQGLTKDYGINLSGGNDKTKFFISGNYFNQKGIVLASDFKRYSARVNVENQTTDYLKLGVSSTLAYTDQNTPPGAGGAANPIRFADIVSNVYPLYRLDAAGAPIVDPTGGFVYNYRTPVVFDYNPVGLAKKNIYNAQTARAILNSFAEISFLKDFKFKTQGGVDFIDLLETQYYNPTNGDGSGVKGRTNKYAPRDLTLTLTNTLAYDKTFGIHGVNVLLGQEAIKMRYDNLIAGATGFPGEGIVELGAAATPSQAFSQVTEKRIASYFSRVNYSLLDRYFVSGSVRRDGSSVFGSDNRNGTFWSAGAAWRISKENFLNGVDWVNDLKLRGSIGISGNDNIARYGRLDLYSIGNSYGGSAGTSYSQLGNPGLQWEANKVKEIGVEFGLFKRVKGEVSYFERGSSGILFDKPLSYTTGFSTILTNLANMKNYGVEGMVDVRVLDKKDFNWNVSLNMTSYKNRIQKMTTDSIIQGNLRWKVGSDRYQYYMREWAGVDPADGKPMWYMNEVATGKKITTKDWNAASRYENGSSLPKFFGGITNKFEYKGFDATVFVFFNVGGKIYDFTLSQQMHGGANRGQTLANQSFNAWKKAGDVTDVPRFVDRNTDLGNNASTRFLFDGSYARLKNLNIGYTLPKSVLDRAKISNARFYIQAENYFTWAKHKGMDPEVGIDGTNNNDIPNIKTLTVGLNLGL